MRSVVCSAAMVLVGRWGLRAEAPGLCLVPYPPNAAVVATPTTRGSLHRTRESGEGPHPPRPGAA